MSPGVIAAIYGAFAAGGIIITVELIKWYWGRRALRKALKMGLFFEIRSNNIIDRYHEKDGTFEFSLPYCYDSFYEQNKTDIARLFDEELLAKVSMFYSVISQANALQKDKLELTTQREATPSGPSKTLRLFKLGDLQKQIQQLETELGYNLCPAFGYRMSLCSKLKSVFKIDPQKVELNIAAKHQEWWNKTHKK